MHDVAYFEDFHGHRIALVVAAKVQFSGLDHALAALEQLATKPALKGFEVYFCFPPEQGRLLIFPENEISSRLGKAVEWHQIGWQIVDLDSPPQTA